MRIGELEKDLETKNREYKEHIREISREILNMGYPKKRQWSRSTSLCKDTGCRSRPLG